MLSGVNIIIWFQNILGTFPHHGLHRECGLQGSNDFGSVNTNETKRDSWVPLYSKAAQVLGAICKVIAQFLSQTWLSETLQELADSDLKVETYGLIDISGTINPHIQKIEKKYSKYLGYAGV